MPEPLEMGDFPKDQLSSAHDLFTDASSVYAQAIGLALAAPGPQLHEACQSISRRANTMLAAGQMLARVVYEQDSTGAADVMAGVLLAHSAALHSQFSAGHPDIKVALTSGKNKLKKLINDNLAETGKSEISKTEAFSLAVRHSLYDNSLAWIRVYEDIQESRAEQQ